MVPLLMGAAPMVSHAVLAEEKEIIRKEGWFTIAGRYFASAFDADRQRRLEAERRVDERRAGERREAELRAGVICAWCDKPIVVGEPAAIVAFRWLHAEPCADKYEDANSGRPEAPDPAAGQVP